VLPDKSGVPTGGCFSLGGAVKIRPLGLQGTKNAPACAGALLRQKQVILLAR
jgi:hypothetical protein